MPKRPIDHTCAICPKPIGRGFLMCGPHWHTVPRAVQDDVVRTYGQLSRHSAGHDEQHHAQARSAYVKARDEAVALAAEKLPADQPRSERPQ